MRQAMHHLIVETNGQDLVEITDPILRWVAAQHVDTGLLTIWCRHTSASLLVQENADPDVRADLLDFFRRVVPETAPYRHTAEGADDMPAHIKAALTQTQLTIPLEHGRLVLGTWQGIYLFEHRALSHRREIILHLIGD
ncbi:MAG TPA: secondary thiamine-phosphate synthase enzyme YjbQ [Acetobacteraceae bacterium]|jgi:secondary thiamine-phosphate synthase enzyme